MTTKTRYTGGTIASLYSNLSTSWAARGGHFPTSVDTAFGTYVDSTGIFTAPASGLPDGILFLWNVEFEDSSAGRCNPSTRFIQASGTGNFISSQVGGYNRDASEDRAFCNGWAFVDAPSASATFQFQGIRDSDSPTAGDGTVNSSLMIVPFWYSNIGMYTSTDSSLFGGTTPTQVASWTTVLESDTAAIQRTTNNMQVKGDNKRYISLGSYSLSGSTSGSRTQRIVKLRAATTPRAMGYGMFRTGNDNNNGGIVTDIYETVTTDVNMDMVLYRGDGVGARQGGADVDGGSHTAGAHQMLILELNADAEVFRSHSTAQQECALAGPVDISVIDTLDFNDAASFTKASATVVNAEQAMDAALFANIAVPRNTTGISSGSRWTARGHITVNGTEDATTRHGNYSRGNQSSTDTHGFVTNPSGVITLALNDDLGVSIQEIAGTEGGGGDIETEPFASNEGLTFWGVNLDTLEAAGANHTALPPVGSLALSGQAPTTVRADFIDTPYVELRLITLKGLHIVGYAPTIDVTVGGDITAEPAAETLVLAGKVPTIVWTDNHVALPAIDDLVLTGELPVAVRVDNHVALPGIDDLVLTGELPVAVRTDDHVALPAVVALTLTGELPVAVRVDNHVALPGIDGLVLTGELPVAVRVDNHVALPGIDDLVLTGELPVVVWTDNHVVLPGINALVLVGKAPTVAAADSIVPGEELLVLSGKAPTVERNYFIDVTQGVFVLDGKAPTAFREEFVTPAAETLVLAGQAPTVERDFFINVAAGALTLAGQAPTVIRVDSVTPAIGTLLLAGQAPTVERDYFIDVAAGALTLAGQAPDLGLEGSIIPPAGSLLLSGKVPVASLTAGIDIAVGAASLALSGSAPSLGFTFIPPYYSRTNYIRYSEDWSQAPFWPVLNLTTTFNSLVADTGTHISRTSATATVITASVGTVVSQQIKIKPTSHQYVWIGDRGSLPAASLTLDLSSAGSVIGSSNLDSSSIELLSDGHYQIRFTYTRPNAGVISANIAFAENAHTLDWPSITLSGGETLGVKEYQINEGQQNQYIGPTGLSIKTVSAVLVGYVPSASVNETVAPAAATLSLSGQAPSLDLAVLTPSDRSNLELQSESMDDSDWTKDQVTVSADGAANPMDGGVTADLVIPTAFSTNSHRIYNDYQTRMEVGNTYTISARVKAGGYNYIRQSYGGVMMVDLTDGSVVESSGIASVTDLGDGWYKLTTTKGPYTSGTQRAQFHLYDNAGKAAFVGDTVSGVYITGVHHQEGGFDTPYIGPTTGSIGTASEVVLQGYAPTIGVTRSPAVGSIVLAGQAPTVERDYFIDVAAGSLALAGAAPTVTVTSSSDTAIAIPAGELRLTVFRGLQLFGYPPTIEVSTNGAALPGVGTLLLSGQVPSVISPQQEDPGAGSLALAGAAPTVVIAVGQTVTPAAAELRLTVFRGLQLFGYPPVAFVTTDHVALPPAGALDITTYAIITDPVFQPAAASLNILGYSFTANTQPLISITVPEATLNFTTYAPERGRGLLLAGHEPNVALSTPTVNPALLVLEGKVPLAINTSIPPVQISVPKRNLVITPENVTAGIQRPTDESSLILEGWAPSSISSSPVFFPPVAPLVLTPYVIETDHIALPAAGALALAGQTPTVAESNNHYVAPAAVGLTLTGQNVTLFADTQLFQPPAGALTLLGQDVGRGGSITPEAIAVDITGYAPVAFLGFNLIITPAAETLALSGDAPDVNDGPQVIPGSTTLALAGQAPTIAVTTGHLFIPNAAQLILTPYTPTFANTLSVLPLTGELVVAGQAVTWTLRRVRRHGARTRFIRHTIKRKVESINR